MTFWMPPQYGPPDFKGSGGGKKPERVAAMSGSEADGRNSNGSPQEIDRSERLQRLTERLDKATDEPQLSRPDREPTADPVGVGRAMRLSSEFMAGVIAGALLGWGADKVLGTSPWGLVILLMLGFAAGIMNVMRAAGMLGARPPK